MIIRRPPRWLRPIVAIVGFGVLVGGVIALFTIDNSAGSLFLIALGVAVILVSVLGRRIELESFELLGAKVKVREVVRGRIQLAETATAARGDEAGSAIRDQALTLQKLAGLYWYVRRTQSYSTSRTATLDRLAARMQAAAANTAFDPAEVATWFHEGDDPLRIIALNVMLARPDCRDLAALLELIDEPRNNFEQFYGLLLARRMVDDHALDDFERRLLADAITRARRRRRFRRDPSLSSVADAVLDRIGA